MSCETTRDYDMTCGVYSTLYYRPVFVRTTGYYLAVGNGLNWKSSLEKDHYKCFWSDSRYDLVTTDGRRVTGKTISWFLWRILLHSWFGSRVKSRQLKTLLNDWKIASDRKISKQSIEYSSRTDVRVRMRACLVWWVISGSCLRYHIQLNTRIYMRLYQSGAI